MPLLPRATDHDDPANATLLWSALGAAILGTLLVVFVQQYLISLSERRVSGAPAAMLASEDVEPLGIGGLTIIGKQAIVDALYAREATGRVSADADDFMKELDAMAISRVERVRVAIIAGVVLSAQEALKRLDAIEADGPVGAEIAWDITSLRKKFTGTSVRLDPNSETALIQRHGFFGAVGAKYGLANDTAHYDTLMRRYHQTGSRMGLYYVASGLALLAGIGWLIGSIVKLVRGEFTGYFDAPAVGGPVYLEVYGLFTLGLMAALLFDIPARTMGDNGGLAWFVVGAIAQWALLAVAFWPLLRGVTREAWMLDMGFHTGEGFFKEAMLGGAAFCVGFPITVLINIIFGLFAGGHEAPEPGGFPMFKNPVSASWGVEILGLMGAVVWAPIVEECVFRGALYRFLSGKMKWWLAVGVSALAFGFMHPYGISGLVQVAVSGIVFGLLREWRGSLVAPITCHALHNGFISLGQLIVLAGLGE